MNSAEKYILDTFEKQVNYYQEQLGDGQAKNYEEYKYVCGQIKGIQFCYQLILEQIKKQEDDDDG